MAKYTAEDVKKYNEQRKTSVSSTSGKKYTADDVRAYSEAKFPKTERVDYRSLGYQTRDAYDADARKYAWASQNQGLTYDEVKRRKATATGDELDYLNQYGTLVGYQNVADYDAELADIGKPSKARTVLSGLGKTSASSIGGAIGTVLGGIPGMIAGGIIGNKATNGIDDGSNAYYDELEKRRNLAKSELDYEKYASLMQNPDFEKESYSVANPDKRLSKKAADSDMYAPWEMSSVALGLTGNVPVAAMVGLITKHYNDAEKVNLMTDDEIKTYNYIYNTKGESDASKYLDEIKGVLDKRNAQGLFNSISQSVDEPLGGVTSTARRVILNPMANLASGANIIGGAISGAMGGQGYDPYSDLGMVKNYTDYSEQITGQKLNDAFNNPQILGQDVPSFLYSTALSSIDSYIGASTTGKYYSAVMGTGAFQTTARQLADEGASQQDIWVKATASGAAEIITEYYSLEQLENIINDSGIDSARKVMLATLRQSGYEGSEEVASDIINHMVDEIYSGKASDMKREIAQYMQMGYSEEEARKKATVNFCVQMGESFLGGALSGGGSAVFGGAGQLSQNQRQGAELRANDNLQYIDEAAQAIDQDSDAYKNYSRLVGEGGKIENARDAQIATTYRGITEQLFKELDNASLKDVEEFVASQGITENASDVAKAIKEFVANGRSIKGLSKKTIKILANEKVASAIENLSSYEFKNSDEKSKQIEQLRKATRMRTIFENATGVEQTETGYRITNADGTTNVVHNDNVKTDEARVMEYVSKYNESAQTIFLENYRKSGNVEMYDVAFNEVYNRGKNAEILKQADVDKYTAVLGGKVLDIYKAGSQLASEESRKEAEEIAKALEDFKAENVRSGKFKSRVEFKRLNKKKQNLFRYAQALSALGLNIEVIDDNSNTADNGHYNKDTNTITINLSARYSDKDNKKERQKYVVSTFAHELTHYLEDNANGAYQVLHNLVKEGLSKVYIGSQSVWDTQIAFERNQALAQGYDDAKALEIAESEVVARACEDILNNNQQMVDILSQADSNVLTNIRDVVMKFFDKFKQMISKLLNGFNSNAIEARAVREIDGLLTEMQKAWADAFTQAIGKAQIVEKMEESGGFKADAETSSVASDMNSTKRTLALEFERLGYKSYEECVDDVAKEIDKKANIGDVEKVKKWIKAEESIAAMIMREQNRKYLDYEADDRYEAIKKNADYKQGTFDLSNLCRKREIFTKMFDTLQRDNPDVLFDADDIATIRQVLVDSHYEVACALCYVEDRRQNMGEIAEAFIGFYKQALEDDGLLYKYAISKPGGYDFVDGKYVKKEGGKYKRTGLYPSKAQRDKYGLSTAQFKATDKYVPKQVDLVTYEGLKKLQQEHPTIAYAFERYNNSRGQQSARVIEGHAEYKREVLQYTDAMVKKANDLGGLRVFSFSDFEAIHLIDVCQIIVDCAKMGVKIQTYTKVPEYAALVRNTGIKLNRSLIPANVGSENAYARIMVDGKQKFVKVKPFENGIAKYKGQDVLAFDIVEGIDVTSKYFLDETDNANIGNILIGMSKRQIEIAMEDPFIDYIIPFHTGQKTSVLHAKGIADWKNYKDVQLDKKLPGSTSKEKEINIYRVIEKYNPTNKYEFTEAFLKECDAQMFKPRFDDFIKRGDNGEYLYTEGYWKLLLDFKMFDKSGNILLQENVRPDIDEKLAKKILNEGKKREEQIRFDDDIVKTVKDALANKHTLKSTKRDSEGNELTVAQEEFFSESKVRDEDGNLMVMYHGTEMGGFDTFEQEDTIANANFFTDSLKVARAYSGSPSIYAPKNFQSVDEFNEFINNQDYRAAYEDGQYVLYLDDEVIETADSLNALYRQYWYASGETDSLNYKTYLNATNPYIVEGKGADWDGLSTDINGESMTTNEVVRWARENGYDSVIFRNITDNGLYMSSADRNTITSTVVAVMNSNQIKSVNNTNPTTDADIRYSSKRDSDGNSLTDAQIKFFDNSKARDKNGNLQVWYHGTSAEEFNVFKNSYRPSFFTTDETVATSYQNRMFRGNQGGEGRNYKVYINAINPLVIDLKGSDWNGYTPKGAKAYNYLTITRELGRKKPYRVSWESDKGAEYVKRYTEGDLLAAFGESILDDMRDGYISYDRLILDADLRQVPTNTDEWAKYAKTNGYDSIIFKNVKDAGNASAKGIVADTIAVFNSNQIKSVDNAEPTSDADIRYSTKRDSEGKTLTKAQEEYFKDSKARDDNGNLLVMYHGTDAYKEFTVFKRGKYGYLGSGIYLSADEAFAKRYATKSGYEGRIYKTYVNITNPLIVTSANPAVEILGEKVAAKRELKNSYSTKWITPADIKKLQAKGYDGIIWKYGSSPIEISVWESNQVKNVDNQNPTENADIRYSTKRDADYMDAINRGDMDTAQKLVEEAAHQAGYTTHLYHGTDQFGFTKIDSKKGDDGISFFATDSEETARTYSYDTGKRTVHTESVDYEKLYLQSIEDYANSIYEMVENLNKIAGKDAYDYDDVKQIIDRVYTLTKDTPEVWSTGVADKIGDMLWDIDENLSNDVYDQFFDYYINPIIINGDKKRESYETYKTGSFKFGTYDLYAKTNDFMTFDAKKSTWNNIALNDMEEDYNNWVYFNAPKELTDRKRITSVKTRDIAEYAKNRGFKGVIIQNVFDDGGRGKGLSKPSDVYIFFNPESDVKSADTITYDDNGNVIPLSERFNSENPDIRYSTKRTTEQILTAENEKLKADVKNLRELVRLQGRETNGTIPTKATIESAARSILKSAHSRYNIAELEKEIAAIWKKLDKSGDRQNAIDRVMEDIRKVAYNVVNDITDEVEVDKVYKKMLKDFRATHVSLTTKQLEYAKRRYGSPEKNYNDYRNAFMGKIILDKNAQSLDTMWARWVETYPEVFEEMSEEDMVDGLLEAYATIKESSEYVVDLDTELAVNEVMQTITEKLWNIAAYQTVADKYASKIKEIRATHRKEMDALRKARDDQRLADEMHYKKILEQVKSRRDAQLRDINEMIKKRKISDKEKSKRNHLIGRIEKNCIKLTNWLNGRDKNHHVVVELQEPVQALLDSLDFASNRMLGITADGKQMRGATSGQATKKDISIIKAMNKMRKAVEDSIKAQADVSTAIVFPQDIIDTIDLITEYMEQIQSQVSDDAKSNNLMYQNALIVRMLDIPRLEMVDEVVSIMTGVVTEADELVKSRNKHSVDSVARQIMKEADAKNGRFKFGNRFGNAIDNFINADEQTPYYFFKHLGKGGMEIFTEIMDGWDAYAFKHKAITDFVDGIWKDLNLDNKQYTKWRDDVQTIEIVEKATEKDKQNGVGDKTKTIQMNIPQIMSFYCLLKRDQARKHIFQKGIKIANIEGRNSHGVQTATIDEEAADKIIEILNKPEYSKAKEVADRLQKFLSTECAKWGNEITYQRFGIMGFTEENYFPIQVDNNSINKEAKDIDGASIYRLLNMSFTKKLTDKVSNALVVNDIFDVFTNHAADMAKYNTLALPTLDLIKVLNYKEVSMTDGTQMEETGTRQSLERAYDTRAISYIYRFLEDLNGSQVQEDSMIMKTLLRNAKIAAVGANFQVALLQPMSYIRAAYNIDPVYLARAVTRRPQIQKVKEECGVSCWKDQGFYDVNTNTGLVHKIKHDDSVMDKIREKSMIGAQTLDDVTWGYLYNACEEWANDNTTFAHDSAEYRQAVNDKFRELAYETQVFDSTVSRSQMMRSKSAWKQTLSAFGSEPTLALNMIYDSVSGFISDIRKGGNVGQALRNNRGQMLRAFSAYITGAILESAMRAAIAKLRKPEDDEEYWRLLVQHLIDELNPLAKVPLVKDIITMLEGYSVSRMEYGGLDNITQAIRGFVKAFSKGEAPTYKTIFKALQGGSQIAGIPASGAWKDATTLWNTIMRLIGYDSLIIK